MPIPLYIVDAFTAAPFAGNPAAVCVLPGPANENWMHDLATEMNLSETAFLHPVDDCWSLRWFTPTVEVDLCGHATLASAHALWTMNHAPRSTIRFQTRSGELRADLAGEWIELDFPALPVEECKPPPGLVEAIGVQPTFIGTYKMDYLLELPDADTVLHLKPDMAKLALVGTRGTVVTARADNGASDTFVSRFFAPGAGIDEDPVTGSAHCALAPYWAPKLGRTEMTGHQLSPRGGTVRVRLDGNRVHLGGKAVLVVKGELAISP